MHRYCFVLILFFLIVSCEKKVPKQEVSELQLENDINDQSITLIGDPAKGKAIYYLNCIACHNLDPKNRVVLDHKFMVLQKNFYQKKFFLANIQRITNQKGLDGRCLRCRI